MAEEVSALQEWVTGRVLYRTEYGGDFLGRCACFDGPGRCRDRRAGGYRLPVAGEDCFVKVTTPKAGVPAVRGIIRSAPALPEAGGRAASRDFCLVPIRPGITAVLVIQVTDLHLGFTGVGGHGPLADDLQAILSEWRPHPAFFAVTGDLSDHGKVSELAVVPEGAGRAPRAPTSRLPGNHDYFDGDSPAAYKGRSSARRATRSTGVGPLRGATRSPTGRTHPGRKWLAADLAAQAPGKPIILLLHYQLGEEFFGLWREHFDRGGISGHWHSSRVWHDGYVTHYNGPCLSFGGIDYSPRGFRVFRWRDGRLTMETVALSTQKGGVAGGRAQPDGRRQAERRVGHRRRLVARSVGNPISPSAGGAGCRVGSAWRRPLPELGGSVWRPRTKTAPVAAA